MNNSILNINTDIKNPTKKVLGDNVPKTSITNYDNVTMISLLSKISRIMLELYSVMGKMNLSLSLLDNQDYKIALQNCLTMLANIEKMAKQQQQATWQELGGTISASAMQLGATAFQVTNRMNNSKLFKLDGINNLSRKADQLNKDIREVSQYATNDNKNNLRSILGNNTNELDNEIRGYHNDKIDDAQKHHELANKNLSLINNHKDLEPHFKEVGSEIKELEHKKPNVIEKHSVEHPNPTLKYRVPVGDKNQALQSPYSNTELTIVKRCVNLDKNIKDGIYKYRNGYCIVENQTATELFEENDKLFKANPIVEENSALDCEIFNQKNNVNFDANHFVYVDSRENIHKISRDPNDRSKFNHEIYEVENDDSRNIIIEKINQDKQKFFEDPAKVASSSEILKFAKDDGYAISAEETQKIRESYLHIGKAQIEIGYKRPYAEKLQDFYQEHKLTLNGLSQQLINNIQFYNGLVQQIEGCSRLFESFVNFWAQNNKINAQVLQQSTEMLKDLIDKLSKNSGDNVSNFRNSKDDMFRALVEMLKEIWNLFAEVNRKVVA